MKKRHKAQKKQKSGRGKESRSPRRSGARRPQRGGPRHGGGQPLVGSIDKNPRGFAFIIAEDRSLPDSYVPAQEAAYLMNGDRVEFRMHRRGDKANGEILKVVERANRSIIGRLYEEKKSAVIETQEGEAFVTLSYQGARHGDWVVADIVTYPEPRRIGTAKVTEVIGPELKPEHDNLIAIAKFGLRVGFPSEILKDAESLFAAAAAEIKNPSPHRRDLRKLPFVTIDGEDAKDFDDAVLVVEKGKGYVLYVAIADVSFFVDLHTRLDKEALSRATSVYLPGTCIPMLPETLSNDLCSLNPATDKLTLVAEMETDFEGRVVKSTFYPAIIKTAARLTYTQVHEFIQGSKEAVPETVRAPLGVAYRLFKQLKALRTERGVLDFQFAECRFELGPKGEPKRVYAAPVWESHKLIEEFMIAANSAVAKALTDAKLPSLYRVHETPESDAIDNLNLLMRTLGFSLTLRDVSPKAFSAILAATTGKRGASTLHKAILRSQKQARYEPNPKGHFGLALRDYAHFTSPIRRYPDLVVHRALKRLIQRDKNTDRIHEAMDYDALGEQTSQRERRAMEAERFVVKRKQCWYLKERLGEEFAGVITGVIAKGVFVELADLAMDGFVPIEALGGMYSYDEQRGNMRRRPGHSTLSIGDKMQVKVVSVSVEDAMITLTSTTSQDA